jgi:hypothetical protein
MSWPAVLTAYSDLPEMSARSADEQRTLVRQAARRRGDALWVVPMLWAFVALAVWGGISFGIVRLVMAYAAARTTTGQPQMPGQITSLLILGGFTTFIATWTLARRALVIRSLLFLVNKAGCPFCHFSLVGLSPEKEGGTGSKPVVRCPECGELVSIFDHGIMPDDLLTERDKRRPFMGAGPAGAYRVEGTIYAKRGRGKRGAAAPKR